MGTVQKRPFAPVVGARFIPVTLDDGGSAMGMRSFVSLDGCALVLAAGTARADDAADARAIIDKAIKASRGEEILDKYKAETLKEKGTYYGMGNGIPYTGHYWMQ